VKRWCWISETATSQASDASTVRSWNSALDFTSVRRPRADAAEHERRHRRLDQLDQAVGERASARVSRTIGIVLRRGTPRGELIGMYRCGLWIDARIRISRASLQSRHRSDKKPLDRMTAMR